MRLLSLLLVLGLIGGAAWWGYTRLYPHVLDTWSELSPPSFPAERVLTDRTGRTVTVRLLGRSDSEVRFVRLSDDMGFQYPIGSLSEADQEFLRRFPRTHLGPLPDQAQMTSQLKKDEQLRRERAELEHRIALLQLELGKQSAKSPTLSPDQIRQRIDDCKNRIIDIDQQLLELAFRGSR